MRGRRHTGLQSPVGYWVISASNGSTQSSRNGKRGLFHRRWEGLDKRAATPRTQGAPLHPHYALPPREGKASGTTVTPLPCSASHSSFRTAQHGTFGILRVS
ncbi:hypothetical protein GN956_G11602 [Arapaima gigas]